MNVKQMSDEELIASLENHVNQEREVLSVIIAHIRELDSRKLYLKHDCTSTFGYLTKIKKYSNASAQRRLVAARLSVEIPTLEQDLAKGDLNLTQISILVRAVKEKNCKISTRETTEILNRIKNRMEEESQVIILQALALEPKTKESITPQADESLRIECTLNKEQVELDKKLKSEMSHTNANPTFAEIFEYAANKALKKPNSKLHHKPADPRYISEAKRQEVFRRQPTCQWRHKDGTTCGSDFRLEVDHIISVHNGGTSELANLQTLCATHNRLKYEQAG